MSEFIPRSLYLESGDEGSSPKRGEYMKSDRVTKGIERAPHRALLYATGLSPQDLNKPFIGIASSFTDLIPGHVGMRRLERFIERGVASGGGVPFIFGIPGICDGIAMGHGGMRYSLPSRELIADMVESICKAHQLDGLVCLTNCDKITPGMLMAIARLNIPSIVVTAGPMISGNYKNTRLSFVRDTFEALAKCKKGEITKEELANLEICACPAAGACQGLYTANTMACLTETLGMSLPGCATALANSAKKERIAKESGERIVGLVRRNILPRTILRKGAFENAIRMDMALGGSTNTVLHLIAIAKEAEVELSLDDFDRISRDTPHITNLRPGGDYFMEDLEYAGGIPACIKRLAQKMHNLPTLSGKLISQIAAEAEIYNEDVIRSLKNPPKVSPRFIAISISFFIMFSAFLLAHRKSDFSARLFILSKLISAVRASISPMDITWLNISMPNSESNIFVRAPTATLDAVSLALALSRIFLISVSQNLIAPARSA